VKAFLAACNSEYHALAFEAFLKTGCRELELAFLEWTDIDWRTATITIQGEKRLTLTRSAKWQTGCGIRSGMTASRSLTH
jgi:integrase